MRRAVVGAALVLAACNEASVSAGDSEETGESGSLPEGGHGPSDDGLDDPAATTGEGPLEAICGDAIVTLGEQCDGDNLGGKTCATFGWEDAPGGLRCAEDCTFDLTSCVLCGNGVLDQASEECDGLDTTETSCASMEGLADAPLGCTEDCRLDYASCSTACGNGRLDPGEECEFEGFLSCSEAYGEGWSGDAVCIKCNLLVYECSLCGDGDAGGWEQCDGSPVNQLGQLLTCTNVLGFPSEGELTCSEDCEADTSDCSLCGNHFIDDDELCDGFDVFADCEEFGFAFGFVSCAADCQSYDTSTCSNCGNGTIDPGEDCDGDLLLVNDCSDLGFEPSKLSCTEDCTYDLSQCGSCGDGIAVGEEQCDGADTGSATCAEAFPGTQGGTLGCTPECELDGTQCSVIPPGDIVITEILYAAAATPDSPSGQWIELHNPSATAWDLGGCTLHSNLPFEAFEIPGPLLALPGGYVVLGTGGIEALFFEPDGELGPSYSLGNTGDLVGLECGGADVDVVIYDDTAPWPVVAPGTAIALSSTALDPVLNDDGANWCAASSTVGPATFGTPGAPNDGC